MAGPTPHQNADELLTRSLTDELESLSFMRSTSLNPACAQLLTTRGKLLRGRLALAASQQGPSRDAEHVAKVAVAIELLHLASLAHDDIVDSGEQRRGAPTAGTRFGHRTAGFAGAWIFARAAEITAEFAPAVLNDFAETALEVCEGGMQELRGFYDSRRTEDDYIEVANLKTASVFSLAVRAGTTLSNAPVDIARCADNFAREFGIAWQIWDDLIDLTAGPEVSGKTAMSDLRHGVYTLPVILALEESAKLRDLLANTRMTDSEQHAAIDLIKQTSGIERAEAAAYERSNRAAEWLNRLPDPQPLSGLLVGTSPSLDDTR